jgi:hypothetical protein
VVSGIVAAVVTAGVAVVVAIDGIAAALGALDVCMCMRTLTRARTTHSLATRRRDITNSVTNHRAVREHEFVFAEACDLRDVCRS